ncbi:pyroglutamyl-peptidase I [Brachybacterium vulturis]|uniref:Pyroglutamyl-peptidase I n=1 Tax=Brachybacterium vulturis TaxID=2017484 RepID=A0A291GJH7_9MICO|nr:pyroglutamyl-peptidase I [Brachybacterium vulturis]ATG50361.1 pyroglutamyl-peptidase I [Brachybacterium vulturis]
MTTDLLLTGFAPFAGAAVNESWEAVRRAAAQLKAQGLAVQTLELPVEFGRAGELLTAAVRAHRPSLVVAVGLAAGRTGISPERVAVNVRDARIPDNAGASPVDEPIVAGGPVGYFSTLPIKAMVAALDGVPGSVSQTAGTYVCNDVFYALQHLLATDEELSGIRGGFVHVPSADVLDTAATGRALARMVEVAQRTEVDASLTGGAEH